MKGIGKVDDISAASSDLVLPVGLQEDKLAKELAERAEKIQQDVEDYNKNLNKIDKQFKKIKLLGAHVIVRLQKEDYVRKDTGSSFLEGTQSYNKIPITTERGNTTEIDNPLPYYFTGVICALGNTVTQTPGYANLKVGDTVNLSWFDLQAQRFYLDKTKVDVMGNQSIEYLTESSSLFPNYEGYSKVHVATIESVNV
jgi:hypothetical protein